MLHSLYFAVWIAALRFSFTQAMEEASILPGKIRGLKLLPKEEIGTSHLAIERKACELTPLRANQIVPDFQKSRKRLIMLDKNGVLKRPTEIQPAEKQEIIKILKALSNEPNTHVWVNSASTFEKLEAQFDDFPGLHLAAEHGAVTGQVGRALKPETDIHAPRINIKQLREDVANFLEPTMKLDVDWSWLRTHGICSDAFEIKDKKADVGNILNQLRGYLKEMGHDLDVKHVYPAGWVNLIPNGYNKGTPVAQLIEKAHEDHEPYDFALAIGNEEPDEVMYEVMNEFNFYSAIVTDDDNQMTKAKYRIEGNHKNALSLLQQLTKGGEESVDDPVSKQESKLVGSSEKEPTQAGSSEQVSSNPNTPKFLREDEQQLRFKHI